MKYLSKETKIKILSEWQASGLNQSDFARSRNLSPSTLSGWLRKFRHKMSAMPPMDKIEFVEVPESNLLVKEKVQSLSNMAHMTKQKFIIIKLATGVVIEVPL